MQADKQITATQEEASLTGRAAWILFAKTAAFALSFALPLLLVRRLSQHEFGLYKQVSLVIGTAVAMLPLGFGMSAFYFFPRERERRGQIAFNILLFYSAAAGAACVALIVRPTLLSTIFNNSDLLEYAPMVAIAILLWVVSSFLEMAAVANQEAKTATVFIVGSQFTKALLLLVAALRFATVESLIYAAIAQGVLQTAVMVVYLKSRFPGFWRGFDRAVMRRQLSYSLPLGLAGLLFTMQMDLHNYFVSNSFGPTGYAIYAIGCFQLPLVAILNESICSVMIPRVSLLQSQGNHREIILLSARVMRKLAAIYFPLYALLMVTGREFIMVLFTEAYIGSWPIFAVNLTMLPLSIIVLDPIFRSFEDHRYFLLKQRALFVGGLLVALWLGATYLGLTGIISIVVCVRLLERAIIAIKMGRVLGVGKSDIPLIKDVGKIAGAALVAAIMTMLVRSALLGAKPAITLIACGAVFSVTYLSGMQALGVLSLNEREAIRHQILRLRRARPVRAQPIP
jgi:O-antigen/teichoic acid export membrane protein